MNSVDIKIIAFAFLSLLFLSCGNPAVPQADYDALQDYTKELEAENDSLQIENAELHLYNDYLEAKLDSLENK